MVTPIILKEHDCSTFAVDLLMQIMSFASPQYTHGPVVKTGPTAGKNRSRNKNGQWRRKRSDAGKPRAKQ